MPERIECKISDIATMKWEGIKNNGLDMRHQ